MQGVKMARQPVKVHIFNQQYTLLTEGDPAETQALAREVDELMTSIANRMGTGDSTRVAVLACLHLADKVRESEARVQALESKTAGIADLLEDTLRDHTEAA